MTSLVLTCGMTETINIYCDESCHLEHDGHDVMALGAVSCPADSAREIARRLRELKLRHGLPEEFEIKWTKVSPAKTDFYRDVVDYFFDDDRLRFRGLLASKRGLRHDDFAQDHDTWYYKMYFDLLKIMLTPDAVYQIFIDIKDTRTGPKLSKLHQVLSNNIYDFDREIIGTVQGVESVQVQQVQLTDLLTGAIGYANRGLATSSAKLDLVDRIRARSGYRLDRSTLFGEEKFNLFHWRPRSV
jgi:hypothetical protein